MKIGFISDVHGNFPALKSVMDAAKEEGIDMWLVLGDLVGYYYSPSEVVNVVRELNGYTIAGNHDRIALSVARGESNPDALRKKYGSGHQIAVEQLDSTQMSWLADLPDTLDVNISGCSVHLCHGAPWNPVEYIYPDSPKSTWQKFTHLKRDAVFYGHSHYANARFVEGTLVLNPGSVGQPRDRRGGAQWAIWNTDSRSFNLRRERYDVSLVQAMCKLHDPHIAYLSDVLDCHAH